MPARPKRHAIFGKNEIKEDFEDQFDAYQFFISENKINELKDNEGGFYCEWPDCTWTSDIKNKLNIHILKAHLNLNRYRCNICKKTFQDKSPLEVHMQKYHDITDDSLKVFTYSDDLYMKMYKKG